jgi:hypothetical protein
MILAVESGIHELGTGRQAGSQSVSVHCAGRRCPRPWATTLDSGHGVMGAICFVSCSRDGLLYCFNLSHVYYLRTCDLLSFNWGKEGVAEETELRSQNQCCAGLWIFKEPPVPWQQQFQTLRFPDNISSRPAGSSTNWSSRTRVVGTRKLIEIVFCRFLASSDTLVVGHCRNKRPPEAEPRGHLFGEGQIVKYEHIIHHV